MCTIQGVDLQCDAKSYRAPPNIACPWLVDMASVGVFRSPKVGVEHMVCHSRFYDTILQLICMLSIAARGAQFVSSSSRGKDARVKRINIHDRDALNVIKWISSRSEQKKGFGRNYSNVSV